MSTRPHPVRYLAVVFALLLGAGFVAYRAGWLPALSGDSAAQAAAPGSKERVMIYSSKSGAIVTPSTQPAATTPTTKPRAVMGGSKSLIITDSPSK